MGSALKGDTGPSALTPAPREDHIHGSALAEGCGVLSLPLDHDRYGGYLSKCAPWGRFGLKLHGDIVCK